MTTDQTENSPNLDLMGENLAKIEELSQRLVKVMSQTRKLDPNLQAPGHELYMRAGTAYFADMMANPSSILEKQVSYWGKALKHFVDAQQAMMSGQFAAPVDDTAEDRRFSNELWKTHPYFNWVKQQYLMSSHAVEEALSSLDKLEPRDQQRMQYFTRQIIDMMSPANFLATNPDALTKAVETDGQSLVDGLENLVSDLEQNDGNLVVTLADKDAFKVGDNIASTPGKVVYRNRMMELLQYAPTTEKVHAVPLIIFPPWINKFYVLDLKEKNSFIKWAVDQGFTVFVVSWVNPDASYAKVGLDEYVEEGYIDAINQAKAITGQKHVNAIGYCIGGTALSLTIALLKKRKDKSVKTATFFTTMADFAEPGEMGVFLTDDFVDAVEEEVEQRGMLEKFFMARTFSFLRANDLVYGPAIRSYMMGEAPPAFDLLYWNGDGTNLPAKMAVQYLRGLCQNNEFCKDGFEICGERVHISDVTVPVCSIACETDHIAAWPSCYRSVQQMGSKDRTMIVSESGHIAGIINPPSKKKYGHYTNPDLSLGIDEWLEAADYNEGSWWPRWGKWLAKNAGAKIPAREPGDLMHPPLADAPGTFVVSGSTI